MPFLVLLGMLPTVTRFAQSQNSPLNFANNFFVTGDYIVAGAYNVNQKFTTINGISYTVGTINVPDANPKGVPNPGITGATSVPKGAQIVAALLYWQTVEKVGALGSGQNGYFLPVANAGSFPKGFPGYPISGTNVSGSNSVAWSAGGCGGTSTGKVVKTYRADVAGGLPVDVNGNPIANTSFQVLLPSVGNASTPLTLGATLVVIYRIPSGPDGSNIPLNAIVIYDGDYAQSNTQLTMTQPLHGFYDAAKSPVSRLTHIVGSGQSNKFQTVYLSSGGNSPLALPSLYGNKLPAFPGWYGNWDNATWTFTNAGGNNPGVLEDANSATTRVVPSVSNQGCVSWGAVIASTTVKNSDGDGILDSWKTNQGYCDASVNNGACGGPGDPAWVDLTGAVKGEKDIFLQYDYMCSTVLGPPSLGPTNSCKTPTLQPNGTYSSDYSFDPRLAVDPADGNKTAIDKVVDAFTNHTGSSEPFALHVVAGNAIEENQSATTCTDSAPNPTCPFPNEPGTIGFREGLTYIKNQNIDPNTGLLCAPGSQGCGSVPVFQHGKKDSYHYVLFSHGVGLPSWFLSDPTTLTSVVQTGNTVTFTTPLPHGIAPIPGDFCQYGRVTVIFAITNPNLEGSYCVLPTAPTSTTFSITVGGSAMNFAYTSKTDPNLSVANGQVTSMSGFSDVGGQNSVVSLGYGDWGPPNIPTSDGNTWQVKSGTFMHELGHTLGLTHGGTFYGGLGATPPDYTPTFEPNCKPNSQSIMSYQFQVDLLTDLVTGNQVLDYSHQDLAPLTKSSPIALGTLTATDYANTAWFELTNYAQLQNPAITPTQMTAHCDGSPLLITDPPTTYTSGAVGSFFSSVNSGLDVNFDGKTSEVLHGHDEWNGSQASADGLVGPTPGLDLQQVSAVGTVSTIGPGGEAGALKPAGGGGALKPAGGGGALKPAGGGGALKPAGGGGMKSDINHQTANAYTRPPRNLAASEAVSPRTITLNWTQPTFGQIVQYNLYRAVGAGQFTFLKSILPVPPATTFPPTMTTDNPSCNPAGYSYEVTAVVNSDTQPPQPQESLPSNVVPGPGQNPLTGCYTSPNAATSPTIILTAPTSAVQGSSVPITWTLTDDFYNTSGPVIRPAANTSLVVNGPLPNNCTTAGSTPILFNGAPTAQGGASTFTNTGDQYTFTWATDGFCAGSYTFQLTVDTTQTSPITPALTLQIDVTDNDGTPHVTTTTLPNGVVGANYSTTVTEDGGVGKLTWSSSGLLPSGMTLDSSTGVLSGIPTAPGSYSFTAAVTDSASPPNTGSQTLTLAVAGPAQTASTLSVLVNGTATPPTVVAYVAKGSWNAGNGGPPVPPGGGPGISAVNIEGAFLPSNTLISTPGVVNSCASNSLTGITVCTADNNDVYVVNGTTVSNTLTSGGTGPSLSFQGGSCTTCGVVMDSVHNQALIAVGTIAAQIGGFQFLNLGGASPTLGSVLPTPAMTNTPANISPSIMLDPTRNTNTPAGNTSYGSGAIVLSAGESGDFEIVDMTNPSTPAFFENLLSGLGFNPQNPSASLDPESSGEDTSTGIAIVPLVAPSSPLSQVFLADLTQATFSSGSPGSWMDTASQTLQLSESTNLSSVGAAGVAVAQGNTHTGVITGEVGGSAITAVLLPSNSGSGTPAPTDWVTCSIPAPPTAPSFVMGYDPHTVTAYQSPSTGDAMALIADQSGTNKGPGYLAVVDLTKMLNPSIVQRTAGGHGCQSGTLSGVVNFIPVP